MCIRDSVYTMVEMAKANGVNVYHYLTYLLEKLPDDRMSDDDLELLAPWNETVKAEIERRANESNQSYVNCQGAPAAEKPVSYTHLDVYKRQFYDCHYFFFLCENSGKSLTV